MTLRFLTFLAALLIAASAPPAAIAEEAVAFDDGWREVGMPFLRKTEYEPKGDELGIVADGSVSIFWSALAPRYAASRSARWDWFTDISVPPTDLTQRRGEDRNISLSFVFAGPRTAERAARGTSPLWLLNASDVRVLSYVYGGDLSRGTMFESPHMGDRGALFIKREAITGFFSEEVSLRDDFERAFGAVDMSLVGLAISSDSDDTDTRVEAGIRHLRLE